MSRLVPIFCLVLSSHASAVIVQSGSGSQNTTSTGAGGGWYYVGQVGGASGVYLGDYGGSYWVLTAGHVDEGEFTLNGVPYQPVGAQISLNGSGGNADLVLFRIDEDPGLPALSLSDTAMTAGQTVTMIGYGIDRESDETYWSPSWQETTNSFLGIYKGYKWGATATKRWGQNTVTSASEEVGNTEYFTATFNRVSGDAQATVGDSGGGVFAMRNGSLVLAGSMGLVSSFTGQPSSTSVYGNTTYAADISVYRSAILEAISPVPEPNSMALLGIGTVAIFATRLIWRARTSVPSAECTLVKSDKEFILPESRIGPATPR